MEIANKPLNLQAIAIEEAETQIRLIVKTDYLKQEPRYRIEAKVKKVIADVVKKLKYPDLINATKWSLWNFYKRQYKEISRINGENLLVLLAVMKIYEPRGEIAKNIPLTKAQDTLKQYFNTFDGTNIYATEMRKFSQQYYRDNVRPVFEQLAKQYPFDPDSIGPNDTYIGAYNKHINSLRNRAELEVRYSGHLENIQKLKEQGHTLVISSSHADCSERCQEWQGRVFSLDGTSGVTSDGRKYVPLEVATDIYYTTRSGKVWKNGLLGFNCRHYLVPYKHGFKFPKPNPKEERKQYAITEEQRHLERNVRYWRTRAIYEKGVDKKAYAKAVNKANYWNDRYITFSQSNGRAYYPSRTKVL